MSRRVQTIIFMGLALLAPFVILIVGEVRGLAVQGAAISRILNDAMVVQPGAVLIFSLVITNAITATVFGVLGHALWPIKDLKLEAERDAFRKELSRVKGDR